MPINRRTFLSLSATSLAAFALDPERLLWRPGAKTFFLPTPSTVRYYDAINDFGVVRLGCEVSRSVYAQLLGKTPVFRITTRGERTITEYTTKVFPFTADVLSTDSLFGGNKTFVLRNVGYEQLVANL